MSPKSLLVVCPSLTLSPGKGPLNTFLFCAESPKLLTEENNVFSGERRGSEYSTSLLLSTSLHVVTVHVTLNKAHIESTSLLRHISLVGANILPVEI